MVDAAVYMILSLALLATAGYVERALLMMSKAVTPVVGAGAYVTVLVKPSDHTGASGEDDEDEENDENGNCEWLDAELARKVVAHVPVVISVSLAVALLMGALFGTVAFITALGACIAVAMGADFVSNDNRKLLPVAVAGYVLGGLAFYFIVTTAFGVVDPLETKVAKIMFMIASMSLISVIWKLTSRKPATR